jgi:hypothetical protein
MAFFAFLLAEKTGWPLNYILWEIPISISNQAMHYYLWKDGAKIRRTAIGRIDERQEIARILGI